MRLKSYLLVTGITAAALFGATPAFADAVSPEPSAVPSPPEASEQPSEEPEQPSAMPVPPEQMEECEALFEEGQASGLFGEDMEFPSDSGVTCEEIIAEWEAAEEGAGSPWESAPPAEPQPADPNYTG
ncbi:FliH/SctL family protein [Nocardiopsis aegyptia]|uniref:Excalibur calcium-binding domain-containing protein n=1 Tax=Nocardiopsis aegyptia TaxID=220378 RepID=A0A7Z0EQK1_9ACTN|nr:hypothetical protein [Nocardiopsis aegyptia]NYJ35916.1 hypothetical protein [Nocardiopsis aegyptia]